MKTRAGLAALAGVWCSIGVMAPAPALAREPEATPQAESAAPTPTFDSPEAALARLAAQGDSSSVAEVDAAEVVLKPASAKEPKNGRWQYGLGLVARERLEKVVGDARDPLAKEYASRMAAAVAADPKNADYCFEYGQSFMASIKQGDGFMTMAGKAGDAKDQWEKGIKGNPDHIGCRVALAQYEIQARKQGGMLFGSYKAARRHGEHLLKVKDGAMQGHLVLASVAAAQEEWDTMSEQFAKAHAAATTDAQRYDALVSHASVLVNDRKDAAAAMPIVDQAFALAPASDYTPYFLRGSARKLKGDCAGAVADFQAVIERNEQARNTRLMLAECLEQTGDGAGALAQYEEFKRRFPQDQRVSKADEGIKRLRKKA